MKFLKTITDKDFDSNIPAPEKYKEREAARAVVFDKDNNVAILHVTKDHYHKIPGGGIEEGEDIMQALKREVLEEIGCEIENIKELGIIEEYRNKHPLHQTSYCFTANVFGEKGKPNFTAKEIAGGFEVTWLSLDDAIEVIRNEDESEIYESDFMTKRDLAFLKEAKNLRNL